MKGRPSLLTPEREERIVAYVQGGMPASAAAVSTGITSRTFLKWQARAVEAEAFCLENEDQVETDENGDVRHPDPEEDRFLHFLQRIRRARATVFGATVVDLRQRHPQMWLEGPPGRAAALELGEEPFTRTPSVAVGIGLTVPMLVDASFQVLEDAGEKVERLGNLDDLKALSPPMLGVDGDSDGREPKEN